MDKRDISIELLRECFEVRGGDLVWKSRPDHHFSSPKTAKIVNSTLAGKRASGRGIKLLGAHILVHRVIYALHHGLNISDLPPLIDHRDCDTSNNRPENLRPATRSQNACNSRIKANNKSGAKGVYRIKDSRKWFARIGINGAAHNLGHYDTRDEAAAAYQKAAMELHGEFARF